MRALIALSMLLGAGPAAAGELDGRPIGDDARYAFTGCEAPEAPDQGRIRTVDAYNEAVDTHQAYVDAVEIYVDCLRQEMEADYARIEAAMEAAAAERLADAQASVDASKQALDERRERFLAESGIPE